MPIIEKIGFSLRGEEAASGDPDPYGRGEYDPATGLSDYYEYPKNHIHVRPLGSVIGVRGADMGGWYTATPRPSGAWQITLEPGTSFLVDKESARLLAALLTAVVEAVA